MTKQLWKPLEDLESFTQGAKAWLAQRMSAEMPWVLIHADEGVIWGRWEPTGNVRLSSDAFQGTELAIDLTAANVQQCRIFGKSGELLIWRDRAQFHGRIVEDNDTEMADWWDEQHLLWGHPIEERHDFSLLREGRQGQQHAVPIIVKQTQRAVLTVRHYVQPDRYGQAAVVLSRLVDLVLL